MLLDVNLEDKEGKKVKLKLRRLHFPAVGAGSSPEGKDAGRNCGWLETILPSCTTRKERTTVVMEWTAGAMWLPE
jgi:hypothetical protein